MYRVCCLMAWVLASLLFPSTTASALFNGEHLARADRATPTALIIKCQAGIQFSRGTDDSAILLASDPELTAVNRRYGVRHQRQIVAGGAVVAPDNPLCHVHLLYPEAGADLEVMARDYDNLDCVEYAHPNYMLELYEIPDDPLFGHQWSLHNTGQGCYHVLRRDGFFNDTLVIAYGTPDADIDALETLENPPDTAYPVIVAIIDTGVDWDHPDLAARLWVNPGEIPDNGSDDDHNGFTDDIHGWNFTDGDGTDLPVDDHGHGTHCAGIVAAVASNGLGIAGAVPEARIMAVKIFYDFSVLNACRGIIYAADNGADVANMSWGLSWPVPLLEQTLQYARSRGVVLVAAAGNDSDNRTNYPSGYTTTIAVTASNNNDLITSFSTHNSAINVCAPGQSILSLRAAGTDMYAKYFEPNVHIIDEDYYLATGTSMAAPHVAAVAAYLRAVSPGLLPGMTQGILESTADDFLDPYGTGAEMPGWDEYSGHGRVNLPAALSAAPNTRADLTAPQPFAVVSGIVEIHGSADGADFSEYTLEYGISATPSEWTEIASSATPVAAGLLGTLLCNGLQGWCTIRLRVNNSNVAQTHVFVTDLPLAEILSPVEGQTVGSEVSVMGSAICDDFDYSVVEYRSDGERGSWYQIGIKTTPTHKGELANWNTIPLDTGAYTLRLSVHSATDLAAQDSVIVNIGSPFSPPQGWRTAVGGSLAPIANYADLNQDGANEILVGNESGMTILGINGDILTGDIPNFPPDDYRIPPAVGRLDADDFDDVVLVGASGTLYGFPSLDSPFQIALSEVPDNMSLFIPGDESRLPKVFLKDIDGDGLDEIHYFPGAASSGRSGYHFIYKTDGSEWGCGFPPANSYRRCLPADLNGDGTAEIYCMGAELAEFDTCGQLIRSVPVEWQGLPINDYQLDMSAVDLDLDGLKELVVHGYFNAGPADVYNYQIFAYDDELQLKEGWPHDLGINGRLLAPGHPVFADLDDDGDLEYLMAHGDLEYGYLHAWHSDGTPVLGDEHTDGLMAVTPYPACLSAPLLLDCNANRFADVVVASGAGLTGTLMIERIMAFDLSTEYIDDYPLVVSNEYADASFHMPVYGDINRDGFLDVVYPSDHGEVVFTNFSQCPYDSLRNCCPMWRYNRRLNATLSLPIQGLCGDADGNSIVNISDAVYLITYIFGGGPPPDPLLLGDVDCNEIVNISDAVYLITYIFAGGPEPCAACP